MWTDSEFSKSAIYDFHDWLYAISWQINRFVIICSYFVVALFCFFIYNFVNFVYGFEGEAKVQAVPQPDQHSHIYPHLTNLHFPNWSLAKPI